MVQFIYSTEEQVPTAQSKNFIQTRRHENEKHAQKPTERSRVSSSMKDRAKTYTRKVLTGIKGSSMLETDARTSGYGDSLVLK